MVKQKRCFRCHRVLALSAFYRHPKMADGHLNKCIECAKRDVRAHSLTNKPERQVYERERSQRPERRSEALERQKELRAKYPEKFAARSAVNNAIRDGRLRRQPCEVCGHAAQAHHDDYSRPLDVRWLCVTHHHEHHRKYKTAV